jgi:hypothetical protein
MDARQRIVGLLVACALFAPGICISAGRALCLELPIGLSDGPAAADAQVKEIARLFSGSDRDTAMTQLLIFQWEDLACQFDDGRPRLSAFVPGLSSALSQEPDWQKSWGRVEVVKRLWPNEPATVIVEAAYWRNYAWSARGTGYGVSVTAEGWRLFEERLVRAEKVLLDSKAIGSSLPCWYELMLQIQGGLGKRSALATTFYEGATRYKTYLPIYFVMEGFTEPKWSGSWESIDELASWSVKNTEETEGQTLYARIYWHAAQGQSMDSGIFNVSHASWPKMKQGFEDLMARHPSSYWNLNNFAAFACQAGDTPTFIALRQRIGKKITPAAWPRLSSLEMCELKAGISD